MVQENHIDKALAFMESLEKLGNQLKAAEEHQKQLIARMLDLKKENLTDGEEYAETLAEEQKSAGHHRQMAPYLSGAHGDGKSVDSKRKRNNNHALFRFISLLIPPQFVKGKNAISL